jgi:glucose/arabinose dehydrogenase
MTARRRLVPPRAVALAAAAAVALLTPAGVPPAGAAGGIALHSIGSFDSPVYVTQPPGRGGIMVVEQGGTIRAVADGHELTRPFLNIRRLVASGGERGLLSVAFPPDYPQTRRFYVYFNNNNCASAGSNCNIEIDEFRRAPGEVNHANISSRRRVLTIDHHANSNHNGGPLQFGPGGKLFIATGDGGGGDDPANNALNKHRLLGKILRIDPRPLVRNGVYHRYRIPRDNPYVGRSGRDEIFSLGLRNPWRFSIDRPATGTPRIAIGDVGERFTEEVDYLKVSAANGADFGWSKYEGDHLNPNGADADRFAPQPVIDPIFAYDHNGTRCAIIGGYVVRQSTLAGMNGRYVYSDNCDGVLRSLIPSLGGASGNRSEGVVVNAATSFGVDRSHRYYVASLNGPVSRLVPN